MERPVQLLVNFLLISWLAFSSCALQEGKVSMSVLEVQDQQIKTKGGITYVEQKPYSGMLYKLYPKTTDTLYIKNYLRGKEHGSWKRFHPGNEVKELRYFQHGRKEGAHIAYYPGGQVRFHYQLSDDVYEGNNREWNAAGNLILDMNYVAGQEEGSQKVWYDNGKLKANYIIKNGRRFGLLGTKNCINVSDSIFQN
ncbi:MAG: toxin-antitoxin system YwqK family antitoxin [Bacteroidota bacterium]